MSYNIRPASSQVDFRLIAAVHRRAFYPSASPLLAAFLEWDRALGAASTFAGSKCVCLLAETENKKDVVATATLEASDDRFRRPLASALRMMTAQPPVRRVCYVSNVSVEAAHRRKGVASQLLSRAQELAHAWECNSMALHCDAADAGNKKLYQALGYRVVSVEPPWMPALQLRRVRLLLMAKRIGKKPASSPREQSRS
jgi:GNAT superfamily N-acetyltransferase